MDVRLTLPGELDGEIIAILVLFNFHCRVQLADHAQHVRKALLLFLTDKIYQEIPPSRSLKAFEEELNEAIGADSEHSRIITDYVGNMLNLLDVSDGLTKLFNEKLSRVLPSYEPVGVLNTTEVFFERRSFFGLFFRRMKLVFDSLDLQARSQLAASARAWKDGQLQDDYVKEDLTASLQQDARISAWQNYQLGLLRGDYTLTKESMENFFDFFAPGADHELHQHTLLHLAAFHIQAGSHSAAKTALEEAISLARSASDYECILACESLMNRVQGVGTSSLAENASRSRSLDADAPRMGDVIWKARCDAEEGKPLVHVIQDLQYSARPASLAREPLTNTQISLALMEDAKKRFGRDAISESGELAGLWTGLGQEALSDIHLVHASRSFGANLTSSSEVRIDSLCQQARKLSTAGRYDEALSLLMSPETYQDMSFSEYKPWIEAVGDLLWLRATRREETKTIQLLAERLPSKKHAVLDVDVEDYLDAPKVLVDLALRQLQSQKPVMLLAHDFDIKLKAPCELSWQEKVQSLLRKAEKHLQSNQASLALFPILSALSLAREKEYGRLSQAATVALAEVVALHLHMPQQAQAAMEQVMPVCLATEDPELRAKAQWTYSRILLACFGQNTKEDLHTVLRWMRQANEDAELAECLGLQNKILYYMARLYHHIGDVPSRDEVTKKQAQVERDWIKATDSKCEDSLVQANRILDAVASVGAYVASGEAALVRLSIS